MNKILLIVIYLAFISLGLPDGVFGVAWPSMRREFAIPLQAAGMVGIILMFCSSISSFASGTILRRFGTGRVVLISGLMTGFALLGYAMTPSFFWLVIAALPLGFGQGAVDSGLNHYVANNYSSRHMNWLHCFWGVGATLGPLIMTRTLAANHSWRFGYVYIAIIQLTLALIFLTSLKLWKKDQTTDEKPGQKPRRTKFGFKTSGPWLGMALFFIYAGVEYMIGLWACSMLVESRQIAKATAGLWVSYFYGALMFGRFATGLIVNKLGNRVLVRIGLAIAVVGTTLLFLPGSVNSFVLLANSPILRKV
jgi:fucose permease